MKEPLITAAAAMKTTIPTVILTMIIYIVIGQHLESHVIQDSFIPEMRAALKAGYTFHWGLFLLPTAIILMSIKKVPATLSLLLVGLLGGVLSIGLQGNSITQQEGAKKQNLGRKQTQSIINNHRYHAALNPHGYNYANTEQ